MWIIFQLYLVFIDKANKCKIKVTCFIYDKKYSVKRKRINLIKIFFFYH